MNFAGSDIVRRKLAAFALPAVAFLVLMAAGKAVRNFGESFWFQSPEYWVYPIQTVICGALLLWFWGEYEFRAPRQIILSVAVALLIFGVWISPQAIFGFAPRLQGFDPQPFSANYWATVILRFLRLVVIVPLVEEVFWRGFLLRYFVREEFHTVPIGTFSWLSFALVTMGFGFAHSPADWVAGLIAGALFNAVAYWTKSLASCVFCHAVTNAFLGVWIMKTEQWGFW